MRIVTFLETLAATEAALNELTGLRWTIFRGDNGKDLTFQWSRPGSPVQSHGSFIVSRAEIEASSLGISPVFIVVRKLLGTVIP